jgi:hypothetical protein
MKGDDMNEEKKTFLERLENETLNVFRQCYKSDSAMRMERLFEDQYRLIGWRSGPIVGLQLRPVKSKKEEG